jgi:4-alpha-glucanotransferase
MMTVCFRIHYSTAWGQSLFVSGTLPELGNDNPATALPMRHEGDGWWTAEINLPACKNVFAYRYFLCENGKFIAEDWPRPRYANIVESQQNHTFIDRWQILPPDLFLYSSAFTRCWLKRDIFKSVRPKKYFCKNVFAVLCPSALPSQTLVLTGDCEALGNWRPEKGLAMNCDQFPEWTAEVDAETLPAATEYKFVIIDRNSHTTVRWEKGENRCLTSVMPDRGETVHIACEPFRDEQQNWKMTGTATPLFALRTENSFGIGDMADLLPFIDWLAATRQNILQLLPINDTTQTRTWTDSYPYNAISIYALHPIYLNLNLLGSLRDRRRLAFYQVKGLELNALDEIDWQKVDYWKWQYFREIYEQEGTETLETKAFKVFFESNGHWLKPYAVFCFLRDKFNTPDFSHWGEFATYRREAIETLCNPKNIDYHNVAIHFYLQFHLDRQMKAAVQYAHSKRIALKGDVPIGVSRCSVETWTEPQLFNMQSQTGAPPDDFSLTGQNWGFPTYRWEAMVADGYRWWTLRFARMAEYFDAYRIDHILGFFRIWEIPRSSVEGLLGRFCPALPLSGEEIRRAGFNFLPDLHTRPRIAEQFLPELFGEATDEVKQIWLDRISAGHFTLKQQINTQAKIRERFTHFDDPRSQSILHGLYRIANEVLFLSDDTLADHCHPRISAWQSFAYRELETSDREAFDRLYHDFFYVRQNDFWKSKGMEKLAALTLGSNMLACGEDLGMIPTCVPDVMHALRIFSLEIERMPKSSDVEFGNTATFPRQSVCTTSTHDMDTIRLWWRENPARSQRYFNHILKHDGKAPADCTPAICTEILQRNICAASMLSVIPLQDWLALDPATRRAEAEKERINIPANPRHYWRYRMHLPISKLLEAEDLNGKIRELVSAADKQVS